MAWVRLDDGFPDHRKLAELGDYAPLCGWLFVCGLAWSNRQLTDGRLPKTLIPRLATFHHLSLETGCVPGMATFGEDVTPEALAQLLVQVGFWEDVGDAYLIHDFLEYQPSRAETLALRKARIKAGKTGANMRWNGENGKHGKPHGKRYGKPIAKRCPGPDPDPVRTPLTPLKGGVRPAAARKRAEEIRRQAYGRCPHEPACDTYDICVGKIADDLRRQAATDPDEAMA